MESKKYHIYLSVNSIDVKQSIERIILSTDEFELLQSLDSQFLHILIYELGSEIEKDFQKIRALLDSIAIDEVFIISDRTDSSILLDAIRAGIKEFISAPITKKEIIEALERYKQRKDNQEKKPDIKYGKIIDIIGSKGGTGTTTVAINLATSLSQMHKEKSVALIDMNMIFGEIPLFLSLEPKYRWDEITSDISELDENFMFNVLAKNDFGLSVLPAPNTMNGHVRPGIEVVESVIELLQKMFDFVIVDCGPSLNDISKALIKNSKEVLIVSTLSLPYLHNTKKIIDYLYDLKLLPDENIKIVINRYEKRSVISLKDAEKSINKKIFWKIPNNFKIASSSIEQGKSLMQLYPRSSLAKNYNKLCFNLFPDNKKLQKNRKKSLFSR